MAVVYHKDAPFNELHNAKFRVGTRPATPEGVGDAHWNATTEVLSLADAPGTSWVPYDLGDIASGSSLPPMALIKKNANQILNTTVEISITWQTDISDVPAWHDTSVNTERVIPVTPGIYEAVGFISCSSNVERVSLLSLNAGYLIRLATVQLDPLTSRHVARFQWIGELTASDYLYVTVQFTSASPSNTVYEDDSRLAVKRLV